MSIHTSNTVLSLNTVLQMAGELPGMHMHVEYCDPCPDDNIANIGKARRLLAYEIDMPAHIADWGKLKNFRILTVFIKCKAGFLNRSVIGPRPGPERIQW